MRYLGLGAFFQNLVFVILLVSCQRTWQPSAQLRPEARVPVNASVAADAASEATIAPYRQKVEQRMHEVIGQAPTELKAEPIESSLGNFVADLQRSQAAALLGRPIDMGLMTRGGLRYIIPQGNITVGDVFELMPFENELLVLTLSGSTVEKLFQFGASKKILALSGATFSIQNDQAINILIGGKPFDKQQTYTVAISDYLANGGDNLGFLKEAVKTEKAGILLRDAIIKHIQQLTAQGKPVEARVEGRVKVL
ncbi:5'-nucleotidase C-terminal domain-containing protein [Adhaeribacter swui]|uniref:5'-nucleotidase C-terminal domain-containing protein n=1 Tax=Adhaeribacter swui TaxID=2086471 RepID=A0A7G7G406_9BACT|nr:5'-nucleotidase [Adhaeribacter swui]QNF31890.1 5'-nucleotidase C-terminal domain-containing protein [Adhaeribacter swui]